MKARFFDKNRDGKWYPSIELDLCELFDEYLSSMNTNDFEQFIEKWMGHKTFLDAATKYIINAYSGSNYETNTTNAKAEILEALTDNRIGVAADKAANSMTQKWYYEGLYWQFYHGMSDFIRQLDVEDAQKWNRFFDRYKEQNPSPSIGDSQYNFYRQKAHEDVLQIIKTSLEA